MTKYNNLLPVDENGFYGHFGGAFVPDILRKNIDDLNAAFHKHVEDDDFQREFHELLRDYVGRPSPLYYARRLSEHYGTNIYLKREDLNHTGAHKINNAIGMVLLAKRMGKKRVIAETAPVSTVWPPPLSAPSSEWNVSSIWAPSMSSVRLRMSSACVCSAPKSYP